MPARVADLVLSLFPGIDLFGRAFESAGFCVVRGPDPITGGDVRDFAGVPGKFDGIIGGPPCQGFSCANRNRSDDHPSVINSREMVQQFVRIVEECDPMWFLMENVPGVPDVKPRRYRYVQRFQLADRECGGEQLRNRHFQFAHSLGWILRPVRSVTANVRSRQNPNGGRRPEAVTTKSRIRFDRLCRRQGLPAAIRLPGWGKEAKYRAVGNGVSLHVGRVLAAAVQRAGPAEADDCPCGCGRKLTGRQRAATATCRKWLQLARERARPFIDRDGWHPERRLDS